MKRRQALLGGLGLTVFLGGCSTLPAPASEDSTPSSRTDWSGRLALQVLTEPAESFSASFELSGSPDTGTLRLFSPFGQTLAAAEWQPGQATLRRGDEERTYPSMEALTEALTGTALPLAAVFGWLRGVATAVEGWQVDLSEQAAGRVQAQRLFPAPEARLRLVYR